MRISPPVAAEMQSPIPWRQERLIFWEVLTLLKRLLIVLMVLSASPAGADVKSGIAAFQAADYGKAMRAFAPDAKAGDRGAQYWMGRIFDAGLGVPENKSTAMSWFEKAAAQGHSESMRILGAYYETGRPAGRDHDRAIVWYERAAKAKNVKAMRNLATMLLNRSHSAEDRERGVALLQKAARMGNAKAMRNLGYMHYFKLRPDFKLAAKYFASAAKAGHGRAAFDLGRLYYRGQGVARDYATAAKHFRRAAVQGYAKAQMMLGRMYLLGEGSPVDAETAHYWLILAKAQNNDVARQWLPEARKKLTAAQAAKSRKRAAEFQPR